jgi:DNA polymerase III subunit epsilon
VRKDLARPSKGSTFAAIDFETADYGRDSACALAVVRVEGGVLVDRAVHLIRPPRSEFVFSYLHGITWAHVRKAPSFGELWPEVSQRLQGIEFLAAHNASFDRSVLNACCAHAGLPSPPHPFKCTMQMARAVWGIYPTKLPDVCRHLGISLRHHDPGSDAEACARIMIAAMTSGPSDAVRSPGRLRPRL